MHMTRAIALAILAYTSSVAGLSWLEDSYDLHTREFDDELFELDTRNFDDQQFDVRHFGDDEWDFYPRNAWEDEYEPVLNVREGSGIGSGTGKGSTPSGQTGAGAQAGNGHASTGTGPAPQTQAPQAAHPSTANAQPASVQGTHAQTGASTGIGAQQRTANRAKHDPVTYQPDELATNFQAQSLAEDRLQRQAEAQAAAQAKAQRLAAKRTKHKTLRGYSTTPIQRNPHHVIGSQAASGSAAAPPQQPNGASTSHAGPATQQGVGSSTAPDTSAQAPVKQVRFNIRRSFDPELYY